MSSILTNTSAMVALQTLKGINQNLGKVQAEISTGKRVDTARDNAAVWAISKVMESDVKGFKGISDSLALGSSTVAVARQAAETVTDLLTDIKGKIVAAQEDNVDRAKIQADIVRLRDQIGAVVSSAQFNGLNLVNSGATMNILASLDRAPNGTVTTNTIEVTGVNLATAGYAAAAVFDGNTDGVSTEGDTFGFTVDNGGGTGTIEFDGDNFAVGDSVSISVGSQVVSYTVTQADIDSTTPGDIVAVNIKNMLEGLGIDGLEIDYDSGTAGTLAIENNGAVDLVISGQFRNAGSGDLAALFGMDVSTQAGAQAALGNIEALMQTSINAAATFGSAQGRIDIQADFIGKLSDSLRAGIGAMVDADMEEASARLQALQVQQQLGIQSLSIANQAPQNILALFR